VALAVKLVDGVDRQALATGNLPDLAAGRRAVAASVPQIVFNPAPQATHAWAAAIARFDALLGATEHGS
jgi:hypothetical protein